MVIGALKNYRRIVVKIGSALLVDRATGLKQDWLQSLGADIAALQMAETIHGVLAGN